MKLTTNALALSIALALGASDMTQAANVTVKILALNDFHGQLESPGTFRVNAASASPTVPVGGVDWLAGYIASYKALNPNTVVVSAGDLIGATPLISALFHDEGTIETMNRAGLDFNAVGNHEFDEGKDELKRMQSGGCHPTDPNTCKGAQVGTPVPFEGAKFKFLAANVVENSSGRTIFPAYAIKALGGVRVAFIGMTLKETPTIVTPSGVAGLTFTDEAEAVNALIPRLRARGAEAVVVLIHQGGVQTVGRGIDTMNQCVGNLDGSPIKTIVSNLDDEVDLVISGHTHQPYNCLLPNKLNRPIPVTSADAQGRLLTNIDMNIESTTGEVTAITAANVVVDRGNVSITPNAAIQGIVNNYKTLAQPIANRVIGSITADITRFGQNTSDIAAGGNGESALGDVIADAQLAVTAPAGFGDAVAAFMNPGGVRADLTFPSSAAGEGDGKVTYGEAFTVQPFGNSLVTLTLTGAQIDTLLEQQFVGCTLGYPAGAPPTGQPFDRILQPSLSFSYAWSNAASPCSKVDPASIMINGVVVDPAASYRVTVNSFLADGGDQFFVLAQGTNRLGGAQDLDALEAWFNNPAVDADALTPGVQIAPGPRNRITRLP